MRFCGVMVFVPAVGEVWVVDNVTVVSHFTMRGGRELVSDSLSVSKGEFSSMAWGMLYHCQVSQVAGVVDRRFFRRGSTKAGRLDAAGCS